MGRSRVVTKTIPTDGDHSHRSKRRKTVSSSEPPTGSGRGGGGGGENGQGHVGKVALYHCNYCNKDISGSVRIKCAVCPDFDLCLECFSVGAEVSPHRCVHPYRVMDNLCFPIISPDWNADEEILLLEGIEMYGFGNWTEVADHVGTKTRSQCIEHYSSVYMNSPCFPFPDLSHVIGKSRQELLAMAAPTLPAKQENSASGEFKLKEESPLPARINNEMPKKANVADKSSSLLKEEYDMHAGSSNSDATVVATKKLSNIGEMKDGIKLQESQADRSIGGKKPKVSGEESGPSMLESSGYNPKREEFEIEYDNDAEHMLADMEFKNTDTDFEREVKLRVLRIYYKRLDERKRRKDFIIDRNLLYPDPFEKNLLHDEKEIYQRFKVFMRYHSKEEHEEFMRSIIEEHRIVRRIQELQEARAAGCQTSAEANKFIEEKRKRGAEEGLQRARENVQADKVLQRPPHHLQVEAAPNCLDKWDITGFVGADLLSEHEKALCSEMRILPAHYLKMMEALSVAIMKGTITRKCEARGLFKVDPVKVDKLYDILVDKGIAARQQPS